MNNSPLKIGIFMFPIIIWGYLFFAPPKISNKILVQKNIVGIKNDQTSWFLNEPILAEKITGFFESKPDNISNSKVIKNIVPQKLWSTSINNFSVGILLEPLTIIDLQILNASPVSQNFDLLISTTSQIPHKFSTKMPTVYANIRQPSDSLNEKFRLANQALIWAESEILFDLSEEDMKIFK